MYAIQVPSGDQAASLTSAGASVTRSASPPPVGSRQTFAVIWPRLPMKASHCPSGDQRGFEADDGPEVACHGRWTPPAAFPGIVDSQICVRYSLFSGSKTESRTT